MLLFGLLVLSGFPEPGLAAAATAHGERAYCLARCVGPSGIRWEEAVVDSPALLGSSTERRSPHLLRC
jgi:hypothetical protein